MEVTKFISILQEGETQRIEFKSSVQKELAHDICAFLNSDGGVILIGVNDEGNVVGVDNINKEKQILSNIMNSINPHVEVNTFSIDLSFMEKSGKYVLGIEVKKGDKLYSYKNRVHIRVGRNNRPLTINELVEKASESILILFDEQKSKFPKIIISEKLVNEYLNKRKEHRSVSQSGTFDENLKQLKIVKNNNATYGGILCFSPNPQKFIPYARIRLIEFESEDSRNYKDAKEFGGPLVKILEDIEKYFLDNLRTIGEEIKEFQRKEYLEYPIIALREVIANALIHRNYFDTSDILIMIYPNKIIIRNPGSFPPGVTLSSPIHKARNPMLSTYLYDLGYIEKWGSGIKKIFQLCKEHPLIDVEYEIHPYHTQVTFYKKIDKVKGSLDDLSKNLLKLIEEKGELGSGDMCNELNKSKPTIVGKLNILLTYGLIQKRGKGPSVTYFRVK